MEAPSVCSCLTAAGRYMSAATSNTRSPCPRNRRASFAAIVVLPEPCRPASRITRGAGPCRSSLPGSPRVAISSSWTILMTCWAGLSDFDTSAPMARSRTRSRKLLTTEKCTSASRSARRTSFRATSTSASLSLPRRDSCSKTPCSFWDSELNIDPSSRPERGAQARKRATPPWGPNLWGRMATSP